MIVTDYNSAVDAVFGIAANVIASISDIKQIRWPAFDPAIKPPTDQFWSRVSEQLVLEKQANLGNSYEQGNKRRYRSDGLVFVQLFVPVTFGEDGVTKCRQYASMIRDAYRKPFTDGSLVFRDQKVKPMLTETNYYQFNVVTTFSFDTFV